MSNRRAILEDIVGSINPIENSDDEQMRKSAKKYLDDLSGFPLTLSTIMMRYGGTVQSKLLDQIIKACSKSKNLTPRQQNWQRARWEGFVWGMCHAYSMSESQVAELIVVRLSAEFDWGCVPDFYLNNWKELYRQSMTDGSEK